MRITRSMTKGNRNRWGRNQTIINPILLYIRMIYVIKINRATQQKEVDK
jgi:hypothetical protein